MQCSCLLTPVHVWHKPSPARAHSSCWVTSDHPAPLAPTGGWCKSGQWEWHCFLAMMETATAAWNKPGFPLSSPSPSPKQSSYRNTILPEAVIKNDSHTCTHTQTRTYTYKYTHKTPKCFLLTLVPPKYIFFLVKNGSGSAFSYTCPQANAGPAALMTDTQQDLSKQDGAIKGDHTAPIQWKSQLGQLLGL